MMKCPSCKARVDETSEVCAECGHEFEEAPSKQTMMGMPSVSGPDHSAEATDKVDRSTLFGLPTPSTDDPDDPDEPDPQTSPATADGEAVAPTEVVSDLTLDTDQPDPEGNASRLDRPADDAGADAVPGTAGEASSDRATQQSNTQVGGSELDDAIRQSTEAASGFSRTTASGDDDIRGTLMGMHVDELDDEESTREVTRDEIEAAKSLQAQGDEPTEPRSQTDRPDVASDESARPDQASADELATNMLDSEEVDALEKRMQSDRREHLLEKLRSQRPSDKGTTDADIDQDEKASTNTRFSIPKPGQVQESSDASDDAGESPAAADGRAAKERVVTDNSSPNPPPDTGIQAFREDDADDDGPIFPIDERDFGASKAEPVDLDDDVDPPLTQPPRASSSDPPQRSRLNFEETPVSNPTVGRGGSDGPAGHKAAESGAPQKTPPARDRAGAQSTAAESVQLVGLVQTIFGVVGAVFLLGAGLYGLAFEPVITPSIASTAGAGAATAVLTLICSFAPMSPGRRTAGFFVLTLAAVGVLAAGMALSVADTVVLAVLGGVLLNLCAASFPVVLRVMK